MKLKFIFLLAFAGIAFAGCNSNRKEENLTDSGVIDTLIPVDSIVVDTTPLVDTALVDSVEVR